MRRAAFGAALLGVRYRFVVLGTEEAERLLDEVGLVGRRSVRLEREGQEDDLVPVPSRSVSASGRAASSVKAGCAAPFGVIWSSKSAPRTRVVERHGPDAVGDRVAGDAVDGRGRLVVLGLACRPS